MTSIIENNHANLSLRLPRDLDELCRQIARAQGINLSSFVRLSIIKEINRIRGCDYVPA